jgi:nucleotide-binding universal stress UspA family protein
MFNRFLVAVDESETGSAAVAFASDAAQQFEGSLRVIHVSDGSHAEGERAEGGATIRTLPRQRVVEEIAEEADRYEADVIVLGMDRHEVASQRFARGIQQRLNQVSSLPVLIAPDPKEEGDT